MDPTPTGQLTPAGRDAIATTRATARRLLAIRESTAMEPAPTTYSSARLAMAAQFKQQPGCAPIDPRHEGSLDRGPTIGRTRRRRRARGRARERH